MANKRYFGKVLPVEYISSPIIPFVIERDNQEQPIICMVCSEPYSNELLEGLVSCTRNLVADISQNLMFVLKITIILKIKNHWMLYDWQLIKC